MIEIKEKMDVYLSSLLRIDSIFNCWHLRVFLELKETNDPIKIEELNSSSSVSSIADKSDSLGSNPSDDSLIKLQQPKDH